MHHLQLGKVNILFSVVYLDDTRWQLCELLMMLGECGWLGDRVYVWLCVCDCVCVPLSFRHLCRVV